MSTKRVRAGAFGVAALVLLGAGGAGCGDDDGAPQECSQAPSFAACTATVEQAEVAGVCLLGACQPLTQCPTGGCDDTEPRFSPPDTNLRTCYGLSPNNTDGTIECPGAPGGPDCAETEFCGEDAQYGWDLEHDSSERWSFGGAAGEPVVTDELTGLSWHGCAAGQSGDQCAGEATLMSWYDAAAFCEQSSWGGHDDWTLPDSHQLHSIVDFDRTSPALDRTVFTNAPSKFQQEYDQWWIECVWSSTDYAGDGSVAWVMMSNSGDISEGSGTEYHLNTKDAATWEGCYTYCVRGDASPAEHERFVVLEPVAGEPVVADTATRLMWQGCSAGQTGSGCDSDADFMDWPSGLAYCEGAAWGGLDDWRLPNIRELRSLVDTSRERPAIDTGVFPNTPYYGPIMDNNAGQYWSSTARSYNSFALYVGFNSGFSHFYEMPEGRHVRCVRGTPWSE